MNIGIIKSSGFVLVASMLVVGSVSFAKYTAPQGHPRQQQVDHRLNNVNRRANQEYKSGEITKAQDQKIHQETNGIYKQEQADKAANGGNYLTKGQQKQLNGEENHVRNQEVREADTQHPRQAEVNGRINNLDNRANRLENNGKITQQQENKIDNQTGAIYKQEQADKAANGGDYLTKGQQAQLNKEENGVRREERHDVRADANAGAPPPAANPAGAGN